MTHTTYSTSKAIKEFLGKEAPIPVYKEFWKKKKDTLPSRILLCSGKCCDYVRKLPYAYQLHDLLSRPFCTAVAWRRSKKNHDWHADGISEILWSNFYEGGMEAVERKLIQMMGK